MFSSCRKGLACSLGPWVPGTNVPAQGPKSLKRSLQTKRIGLTEGLPSSIPLPHADTTTADNNKMPTSRLTCPRGDGSFVEQPSMPMLGSLRNYLHVQLSNANGTDDHSHWLFVVATTANREQGL